MELDRLDLIVSDVPGAAAFFADALGLRLTANEVRFAEVDVGAGRTIMLSRNAMVPTEPARGVILHFRVEDVHKAVEERDLMERRCSWSR
jgi:catechol 2,3-dioxygenase-like lactoylglutathione lyase family enzyme